MLRYLLFSLFLSSSVQAKVCPEYGYYVNEKPPQKVSLSYVMPECHKEPFFDAGCSRFYDDIICSFYTADKKYQLRYIKDGGYGSINYKELYFKGAKPQNCEYKVAAKFVQKDPTFAFDVNIKNNRFKFYRSKCDSKSSEGPSATTYKKTRCLYRNAQLPHLAYVHTRIESQNGRKERRYLIGCN